MQPHQLLHQSEADSAALDRTAPCALDAAKPFEQVGQLLDGDAGPGIAHGQFGGTAIGRWSHLNRDLAGRT